MDSINYRWQRCKYYTPHLQTIKEYIGCLYAIDGCCTGGMLHILLDDDNIDDDSILFCLRECIQHPEREDSGIGKLICEEYLKLTMPQRRILMRPYILDFQCQYCNCSDCLVETGEEF